MCFLPARSNASSSKALQQFDRHINRAGIVETALVCFR